MAGAGLAGLVSARALHRAGWEVIVLEASDGVGGRVRTDEVDGFKLDRGFQVLFTAYPAVKRQLDLKALKPRRFDSGAIVVESRGWNEIGDPFSDPKALAPTVLSTVPLLSDKLRALRLRRLVKRQSIGQIFRSADRTTADFLREFGFSPRFVDLFMAGFLGGIFLDRDLGTSSRCFLFDVKMLVEGRAIVPRNGMQAIPEQIASGLPEGTIRLGTPVLRLEQANGRVIGVQTSREGIEADVVLLAAHAPEVERLSGMTLPKEASSVTCLYFHLPYPLYGHKKLVINGFDNPFVNNAVQITNVAPSYAPAPEHLLSVSILGAPDLSLEQLTEGALRDMQRWFPWRSIVGLRLLAAYQVPFARLAQPPGFRASLPANRTDVPGLYLAGEFTEASSINAAMISGEKAARAIARDFAGG